MNGCTPRMHALAITESSQPTLKGNDLNPVTATICVVRKHANADENSEKEDGDAKVVSSEELEALSVTNETKLETCVQVILLPSQVLLRSLSIV